MIKAAAVSSQVAAEWMDTQHMLTGLSPVEAPVLSREGGRGGRRESSDEGTGTMEAEDEATRDPRPTISQNGQLKPLNAFPQSPVRQKGECGPAVLASLSQRARSSDDNLCSFNTLALVIFLCLCAYALPSGPILLVMGGLASLVAQCYIVLRQELRQEHPHGNSCSLWFVYRRLCASALGLNRANQNQNKTLKCGDISTHKPEATPSDVKTRIQVQQAENMSVLDGSRSQLLSPGLCITVANVLFLTCWSKVGF
jgi:hypothetical protein